MATIHRGSTLTPTKLELIGSWLPHQPWYRGGPRSDLAKAGGFRLDDPAGAVGVEFLVITEAPRTYLVPLTYRDAPLAEAEHALLGTAEHEVLGTRWVYDGARDPLLVAQLFALLAGEVTAQAQDISDTPDRSVTGRLDVPVADVRCVGAHDAADATALLIEAPRRLILRLHRVLPPAPGPDPLGELTAEHRQPDGTTARSSFASVHDPATAPLPRP